MVAGTETAATGMAATVMVAVIEMAEATVDVMPRPVISISRGT